jgi:nucleoside-diphosphate-sugar epimerase
MRVLLAGATGAIGGRMVPLLLGAGHEVTGTSRSPARASELERVGVRPALVDFFDASAVFDAFRAAKPDVVIHQLTDLPRELDAARLAQAYAANARLRIEGTRNLIAAAHAVSARRLIVQSIAFAYAPGPGPHPETEPLDLDDPIRAVTIRGAVDMEQQVQAAGHLEGIILRYGFLYGPGTWFDSPIRRPAVHVDAAAHAAFLAITRGAPGFYNIADDDEVVAIAKARAAIGFDPQFRLAAARVPLSQKRDARVTKV